jgi:uncharacterized protein YfaT (DUF1175 family)
MPISGSDLVNYARTALGTPYQWGGNSLTGGVDCSGLVQQVYGHFGIQLPRVTYQQITQGASVPVDKLQPGDLVFFDTEPNNKGADHVGIYIGGGKFIHAPHTGDVVKISSLSDSYYMNRLMGSRRINGVDGYAAPADGGAMDAAPAIKLSADELAGQYGMSYAFFKSQPELMGLLNSAVSDQWTPDRFTAALKNTKWWTSNSESARKAQVQAKTDPATHKASIAAAAAQAQQLAVKTGAILSAKQVQQLAKNMVDFEWNEAQISNFLGQYVNFTDKHTLGGQAGAAASQITQYAHDQGVRISDETVKNSAAYLVRGITTMQQVQDGLRQQAVSTYPGFAPQLTAGATMRDIAQPYIQMTAQELELPETDIDVWHPKVRAALNAADSAGRPAPMGLADFRGVLRTDPTWRRTQGAQDQTMQIGRQVLGSLGLAT